MRVMPGAICSPLVDASGQEAHGFALSGMRFLRFGSDAFMPGEDISPPGPCAGAAVATGGTSFFSGKREKSVCFAQRFANGEALTITNPDMTRFWMAPSEAVRLVCGAALLQSGMILIPTMRALSIEDMAHIIAPKAAHHVIGLRSVEKVHEDLFHADEPICSSMDDRDFIVVPEQHPHGTRGGRYTSDTAPRLTPDAFLAMLEEAATYD